MDKAHESTPDLKSEEQVWRNMVMRAHMCDTACSSALAAAGRDPFFSTRNKIATIFPVSSFEPKLSINGLLLLKDWK